MATPMTEVFRNPVVLRKNSPYTGMELNRSCKSLNLLPSSPSISAASSPAARGSYVQCGRVVLTNVEVKRYLTVAREVPGRLPPYARLVSLLCTWARILCGWTSMPETVLPAGKGESIYDLQTERATGMMVAGAFGGRRRKRVSTSSKTIRRPERSSPCSSSLPVAMTHRVS